MRNSSTGMPKSTGNSSMPDLFLGIDIGTSGARAIVIDADEVVRAEASSPMAEHGTNHRAPQVWWAAASSATEVALAMVDPRQVRALAIDGTSGTMLSLDASGAPLGDGLMYNDACADAAILDRIAAVAPADSAARGSSSALARAIRLAASGAVRVVHQADWIAWHFSGRVASDENNALKTGYDLGTCAWPDWIGATGFDVTLLPDVVAPGTPIGPVTPEAARAFGLSPQTLVVAGTTDGCASFVATGANAAGDGVTALGTTMTLKLLSDREISAPEYGIYSHRILSHWLAGGASNTGGGVLLAHFDPEALAELSSRIDPETDSPYDYYPLAAPGERFPIADPTMEPRLDPRPDEPEDFLKGMLDGIARIEALAYARLAELGAPRLRTVRTVGGGASNPAWTRLRARRLDVPMPTPASVEAAYGSAVLACLGAR